ncbi:MAG: OmpA family protein [Ignavibacteriales bacterium]|nr:OmpA family protein [Ignavibacteriales bacterium]
MKQLTAEPIIRIVKKKRSHSGGHGGAWKVAYADFVTAMMALFIVLWIVGQNKNIKDSVASYFRDPKAFSEMTKGSGLLLGGTLQAPRPAESEAAKKLEEKKLSEMGEAIKNELKKNPDVTKLINQIKIEIVNEGLRIELLESSESYFFDIGTAVLKREAIKVLSTIAQEVGKLPNKVIVEGHTDSRQYSNSNGYTNFELSADRANSARRVLITNGVRGNQITEVRGYADSKLKNKENPLDAANRRTSIIIQFEGQSEDGTASNASVGR